MKQMLTSVIVYWFQNSTEDERKMTDKSDGMTANRKYFQSLPNDLHPTSVKRTIWIKPRKKLTERRLGRALKIKPNKTMPLGLGISVELIKPTGMFRTPEVYPSHIFVAWSSRHCDICAQ